MLLYACALVSGAIVMSLEMLIGRTLTPYFGGTVYTWGALISVFLAGMACGYAVAGLIADRRPTARVVAAGFALASVTLLIPPFAGDAILNRLLDVITDDRLGALAAAFCLAFAPAALLASVSPCCLRLLLRQTHTSGALSGRLSAVVTLGSIVGALATSFFLIPVMGVKAIYLSLAVLSAVFAVLALAVSLARRKDEAGLAVKALACAAAVGAIWVAPGRSADAAPSSLLAAKNGVLEQADSQYNSIVIEKDRDDIVMEFGYRNTRYTESVINLRRPYDLEVPYTRVMTLGLAYTQQPARRLALVGLGGGNTVTYLLKYIPTLSVEAAELDPEVIRFSKKYFGIHPDQRLKVVNQDGRVFLRQSRGRYDIVMLDAYRGPFVPFHLTTKEFYQLVKSKLNPGGVVVQNVDPATLLFNSTFVTLKTVFANVDAYRADENIVLIAYDGPPLTAAQLAARAQLRQAQLRLPYSLPQMAAGRAPPQRLTGKVLTDDFAPVEMLNSIRRNNQRRR
ncbi:MAG TPA: fused MFS/spermidine synthase [Caulobacteraceae bacterium]